MFKNQINYPLEFNSFDIESLLFLL